MRKKIEDKFGLCEQYFNQKIKFCEKHENAEYKIYLKKKMLRNYAVITEKKDNKITTFYQCCIDGNTGDGDFIIGLDNKLNSIYDKRESKKDFTIETLEEKEKNIVKSIDRELQKSHKNLRFDNYNLHVIPAWVENESFILKDSHIYKNRPNLEKDYNAIARFVLEKNDKYYDIVWNMGSDVSDNYFVTGSILIDRLSDSDVLFHNEDLILADLLNFVDEAHNVFDDPTQKTTIREII